MNKYEFTFLIKEEKDLKKIEQIITSFKGKILQQKNWGKKSLAYPIKKQDSAFFYIWKINLPKTKISEFKKNLNYNEKILRYLLLMDETIEKETKKSNKKSNKKTKKK